MTKKLDPVLRARLRTLRTDAAHPQEAAPGDATAVPLRVIVEFTGDLADLVAAGFSPTTVNEHADEGYRMATGTVPIERLEQLAAVDHVLLVSHPEQYRPLLDYSVPEIHANALHAGSPIRKGAGVVIGVIDSGVDWRHGDFVKPNGTSSRILAIWDQLLTARPGETAGPGSVGVVYTQEQLSAALQGNGTVRTFDLGIKKDKEDERSKGHGTHVAGIAAGDGSSASCCHSRNTYVGVAPLAELVVVRSDFAGDNLISAINFIFDHPQVAVKPVVINMSLGGTVGPHDGTMATERHINQRVTARPGRAIVVAAGNSGDVTNEPCHVMGTVPANGAVDIEFTVPESFAGPGDVDVWYDRAGRLNATLTAPGGTVIGPANHGNDIGPLPANPTAAANRRTNVTIDMTVNGLFSRNNNVRVRIDKPTAGSVLNGSWKLRLANPTATPVSFHAWTNPSETVHFLPPVNPPDGKIRASAEFTVESPGSASGAITVANHASRTGCCDCWPSNDIVPSSSRGPVARDAATNPKPDIAAPGLEIAAPAADAANLRGNCCSCCPDTCCCLYTDKTGTSMSAPHVAGAVALMLEENPNLTKADIVRHLKATARAAPPPADAHTPNIWGAGKLDAKAAVEAVRGEAGGGTPAGGGGGGGPVPPAPRFLDDPPRPAQTGRWWSMDALDPGNGHHHPPVPTGFLALRERMTADQDGERLAAAASRHFSEVRRLINTNRRVATMWHRANGPSLLRNLIEHSAGCPCPAFGDRESRYLARFFEQLERYGSPRLRAGLEQYRAAFLALLPVGASA